MKILAIDQATKVSGYALFINNKLKECGVVASDKDETNPIERIRQMGLELQKLIHTTQPDYVVFENVQYQRNQGTFKMLSQLQGVLMEILFELNIDFTIIESTAWKSFCGIKGKDRAPQKLNTKVFVKEAYNQDCTEDEADAIGIGHWAKNNIKEA